MIENFEKNKHILTMLKKDENVKKSKNREHFIISVLKVGQGKKNLFLWFLYVFMLFWGGQKMSVKKNFWKYFDPPQKSMKTYKNHKNKIFLPWPTFKTDIIKCSRFLDFFTFSSFLGGGVKKKVGKIMPLRMAKYVSETC